MCGQRDVDRSQYSIYNVCGPMSLGSRKLIELLSMRTVLKPVFCPLYAFGVLTTFVVYSHKLSNNNQICFELWIFSLVFFLVFICMKRHFRVWLRILMIPYCNQIYECRRKDMDCVHPCRLLIMWLIISKKNNNFLIALDWYFLFLCWYFLIFSWKKKKRTFVYYFKIILYILILSDSIYLSENIRKY